MVCSNASISNASSPAWFGEFLFETNATARFHYIIGKKNILARNVLCDTAVYSHLENQLFAYPRAISIKGLYAKMAKLSYIHQINQENKLLLLEESKVIFNAF